MKLKYTKALINYQKTEEKIVLSLAADKEKRMRLKQMYDLMKIKSSDIHMYVSRVYSAAEVKELCMRTQLRVNMTLYNCVWDAQKRLDMEKRLSNRSPRFVNDMMAKAVEKRMVIPYSSVKIAKCNYIRSCQRKKDNNCRLDSWRQKDAVQPNQETVSTATRSVQIKSLSLNVKTKFELYTNI